MSQTTLIASDQAAAISLKENISPAPASIVSRAVLQTPEARVTLFTFAAGQELTSHTNRRRALVQVLEGSCDFHYNDAWHRLDAGAFLNLPPNHRHAVRATEAFTMLLTLCTETSASLSQP
jgi:quercetin dioxygenase-like cupin family protein